MPEAKNKELRTLKIDMVSIEKRLGQLGASELLQSLADLVSGAIEDLQVKAEKKEGENSSPSQRQQTMGSGEKYEVVFRETVKTGVIIFAKGAEEAAEIADGLDDRDSFVDWSETTDKRIEEVNKK